MDKDFETQEGLDMPEESALPETAADRESPKEMAARHSGGGKNILAILLGLVVFAGVLAFCWHTAGNAHKTWDVGVLYAKDNEMHFYDLKNEPYLLAESISSGGSYHYYYSAWGATFSEKGGWAYYAADIDANGKFDLFRKNTADPLAEPEKISENVLDYSISKDGRQTAYLKAEGEEISLWLSDGAPRLVSENMQLDEQAYLLSGDGKYLLYTVHGTNGIALHAISTAAGSEAVELSGSMEMYALAEGTGTVYYVAGSETDNRYDIYGYGLEEGKKERVAENVAYMEVMPNGRDLLYCRTSEEKVLYSDLIEDDMAEADAALPTEPTEAEIAENPALAEKLERDKIRQAMRAGEGFDPVLLECYILTNGKTTKAAENVISAVAVANDLPFVTGYQAVQPLPVPLSELDGDLQLAEFAYYGALADGEKKAFLADAMGHCQELPMPEGSPVSADTVQLSEDGSRVAYFVRNMEIGTSDLMLADVQDMEGAAMVQTNTDSMAFLGGSGLLGYYCNYSNGVGTVATSDGNAQGNACGVYYADDEKAMYFISEPNGATGNGTLKRWDGKNETVIAENAFAFQYKANGKLAYLQNYDLAAGMGDLYYYDGKQSRLLDTGVTALFMY